jgi:hypothetical protein
MTRHRMDDELERIRRAEERLDELERLGDPVAAAARFRRHIRRSIAGAVLLTLLAFAALLPLGAAVGMVLRLARRMLFG